MHDGRVARSYYIRGRTIDGNTITVGPYEKRLCEQVLGDIRNHIALDHHELVPTREKPVHYNEIDLRTIGMEASDDKSS